MFSNPGEKIKKIAVFIFCITVIAAVILAFVYGVAEERVYSYFGGNYHTETIFQPLPFFGFLIGVPLIGYIVTLFLVAFGELVQNTTCLVKIENDNKKCLSEIYREEKDISGYLFVISEKEEQNK